MSVSAGSPVGTRGPMQESCGHTGQRGERRVGLLTGLPVSCGLCIQEREETQVTLLPGPPVQGTVACSLHKRAQNGGGVGLESTLTSGLHWPGTEDSGVYIFNYLSICLPS